MFSFQHVQLFTFIKLHNNRFSSYSIPLICCQKTIYAESLWGILDYFNRSKILTSAFLKGQTKRFQTLTGSAAITAVTDDSAR